MWQREVLLCISMSYEVNKEVHVAERGVVVYKHGRMRSIRGCMWIRC